MRAIFLKAAIVTKRLRLLLLVIMISCLWGNNCSLSFAGEHIIVTSEEMMASTDELREGIERVVGQGQTKELDYESPQAKVWIEKLKIDFIPYVIFDKGIEQDNKFFELSKKGMIERRNGEYVIPEKMLKPVGVMFFKRERKPYQLDIFMMSHCPPGNDALRQIDNYLRINPGAFNVICHYITTFRNFGIDSLRGSEEIKEDIRQLLIQKYYSDKFWEYQRIYRQGKHFEDSCKELGINPSELMMRQEEGIALLREDFSLCEQLGIRFSPTFLWENRILLVSMDGFRQFMPQRQSEDTQTKNRPVPGAGDVIPIAVFYRPGCKQCQWVLDTYIPKLKREFGEQTAFEYYDISFQENFEKKLRLEEEFGVIGGTIPQVFIAGRSLAGRHEIENKLKDILTGKIIAGGADRVEQKAVLTKGDAQGSRRLIEHFKSFTPLAIVAAGLLDGINPCAFSTIVFFLSFLVFAGFNLRQMVLVGISFTLAVFLTYLGLGLGAFAGIERLKMFTLFSKYLDTTVGGLAIVLGIGSLYDYNYFKRKGMSKGMLLQLPRSIKNAIHKSIHIIRDKHRAGVLKLLFIAFTIGVLVSLLESICTGQVYLPTLMFILKMKIMWWRAFLFLLLYNVMFILPLIIVFLLTLYGVSSQWWAGLMQRSLGKIKLVTALFFFALGAFIILWS